MGEQMIPSKISLVKYNVPEVVTTKDETRTSKKTTASSSSRLKLPRDTKKNFGAVSKETEEILNKILPPREWEENGKLWRQTVCTDPATRTEVIKLGEQLDLLLEERQAKEGGICPVRRELYTQCFDELVRQISLNCVEQGILLLRVRDEMRLTTRCYQATFESSIAYGIRKAIQAEEGKAEKEEKIKQLELDKKLLQERIDELIELGKQVDRRNTELREAEQRLHEEETQFLKKANQQLKLQLEGIIAPKK